jgi:glycosyltransferase involved in cell wall biosynthesis
VETRRLERMRLLFFGTYDANVHPRIRVLMEGLSALGATVHECNAPLGLDTAWRVRLLRRPWLLPVLAVRLARCWTRLWWAGRRHRDVDAVVVGYLGQFDVHLARRLWPHRPIALDYLVSGRDTSVDRRVTGPRLLALLERADRAALNAADAVVVDTRAHYEAVPDAFRRKAVVTPVGAPSRWFNPPTERHGPPTVVFFGLFTPLQGTPVIGRALGLLAETHPQLRVTMIGHGQDLDEARALAARHPGVEWSDWVAPDALPATVAGHDICLGIFGDGPKALRVVPNKVYQGAAASCAVVTSDTPPQREALDEAGVYVPPADADALAKALAQLADDPAHLWAMRQAAHRRAEGAFSPAVVAAPLYSRLEEL